MVVLEKVKQLQQQGMSESQIAKQLRQEGITAKDINEALSQSKIVAAVGPTASAAPAPEAQAPGSQMQPSQFPQTSQTPVQTMPAPTAEPTNAGVQEQPIYPTYPEYPTQQAQQGYDQGYDQGQQGYYEYQQPTTNIDTINDVAEQIIDSKLAKLKDQIKEFKDFKDNAAIELESINNRLLKLENTINEIQMAIIKKVGDYGEDIKNISKELQATQDTFSKLTNPLTDNIRELQKITGKETTTKTEETKAPAPKKRGRKKKEDFESYLR